MTHANRTGVLVVFQPPRQRKPVIRAIETDAGDHDGRRELGREAVGVGGVIRLQRAVPGAPERFGIHIALVTRFVDEEHAACLSGHSLKMSRAPGTRH